MKKLSDRRRKAESALSFAFLRSLVSPSERQPGAVIKRMPKEERKHLKKLKAEDIQHWIPIEEEKK